MMMIFKKDLDMEVCNYVMFCLKSLFGDILKV